jgi:hypothetical protein
VSIPAWKPVVAKGAVVKVPFTALVRLFVIE